MYMYLMPFQACSQNKGAKKYMIIVSLLLLLLLYCSILQTDLVAHVMLVAINNIVLLERFAFVFLNH